jgi:iron complex transport system substrate-binding protein
MVNSTHSSVGHEAPSELDVVVRRRPLQGPDIPWSRRRLLAAAGAAVLGGVLVACGDDADDGTDDAARSSGATAAPSPSDRPSTPTTAAGAAGFPRTVEHAVGSTLIETKPERIVAATDGAELAALLALGVTPIGFGQRNDPLTPWIAEAGGDDPAIERYELASDTNYEVLAGWRPDVIVGQYGFVTQETIDAYSRVAPTVATNFVDWRTSLRQVAATVGLDDRAEELIGELDGEIAAAGERLAGTDVRMAWVFGYPDYYGQLNDRSPIGALLTEMGLPTLAAQVTEGEAADQIFPESIDVALTDVDGVIVLDFDEPAGDGQAALSTQALFTNAPAVVAGRVIELGVEDSNAAYFDSILTVRRNLALIERVIGELS